MPQFESHSYGQSEWWLRRRNKGAGKAKGTAKGKGFAYRQGNGRRGKGNKPTRRRFRVNCLDTQPQSSADEHEPRSPPREREREPAQDDDERKSRRQESRGSHRHTSRDDDEFLAMPLFVTVGNTGSHHDVDAQRRHILTALIQPRCDLPAVKTLIDTCCSVSLVSENYANQLQRHGFCCRTINAPVEVGMAAEGVSFTSSSLQEVPLVFNGVDAHCVRVECPIIKDLQWPLILGINHLTLLHAKINCHTRVVQLEHGGWHSTLKCTATTGGEKSALVISTYDVIRAASTQTISPGVNEIKACFVHHALKLPERPWLVGVNCPSASLSLVEGPIDQSALSANSSTPFTVLVANTSSSPTKVSASEPLGRVINRDPQEFSDVLKDELTRERQLLNEAREHAFEDDANRDLPPIGDENVDKKLPRSDEQYAKEVLAEIRLDECTNLSTAQKNDLKKVITKWCRIFHLPGEKFEEIRGYKHHIDTGDHEPLYCTPYPLPESHVRFVKSEIDRMIAEGICRPSESSWSSPILVVAKKDEHGQKVRPRLVIDYRRLNSITRFDAYPLPQIETLLSRLNKKCFYSKLDMYSGFWHVGMAPDSISRTAFTTPYGIFEYLRLPFGLVGAPATFMRTVNSVFADLLSEVTADSGYFLCAYMDDLLISSSTWTEHLQHLSRVFERCAQRGVKLKPSKCYFGYDHITYLGYVVSKEGISADPAKTAEIQAISRPTCRKDLQHFLGLSGYYRAHICDYAQRSSHLRQLIRTDVPWHWGRNEEEEFKDLKRSLSHTLLVHPDFSKPFLLQADGSSRGLGAALSQVDSNGIERPVRFASRALTAAEAKWSTEEHELLAIVWAVEKWHQYLYGRHFVVATDHNNLRWLLNLSPRKPRLCRWILRLCEYDFDIVHRKGPLQANVDYFSRHPVGLSTDPPKPPPRTAVSHNPPPAKKRRVSPVTSGRHDAKLSSALSTAVLRSNLCVVVTHQEAPPLHLPSRQTIISSQRRDPVLSQIIQQLSHLNHDGYYRLDPSDDALLMCAPYEGSWDLPEDVEKLVIPVEHQLTFLRYFHVQPDSAHRGREATLAAVGRSFWWSGLAKSVKKFCKRCLGCQLRKKSGTATAGFLRTSIYTQPFTAIGVDLIEMPPGDSDVEGHPFRYILHAICLYSNFIVARPLRTKSMPEVGQCLYEAVICNHGYFRSIRSDRGREFCNSLLDSIYKIGNVVVERTSPLRPKFNGQCERGHRFPLEALSIICSGRENRWPQYLQAVTYAHNTNPGVGRLHSPYYITHGGRNPQALPDLLLNQSAADEVTDLEIDAGAAVDRVEAMKTAHACVRLALLDSRLKAKDRYDQGRTSPDYGVGDYVGVRTSPRASKLSLRWRGPYVIDSVSGNTVLLKALPSGPPVPSPSTRINVDRLVHLNFPAAFHYDIGGSSPSLSERNTREQRRSHSEITSTSHPPASQDSGEPRVQSVNDALRPCSAGADSQKTNTPAPKVSSSHHIPSPEDHPLEAQFQTPVDHCRRFVLVDRSSEEGFVPLSTTADDRRMITALYEACDDPRGLSPRRAVELIMDYPSYRRGYLKRLSDHTISLEQDQFGWLHRLQDHLYFIQDALGVGYVVGEVLREVGRSPEERDLLVQYYKMMQSGGDVLEMDTFGVSEHSQQAERQQLGQVEHDRGNYNIRRSFRTTIGLLQFFD